ncbi:DUF6182 family protein [Micromonospora sp. DT229]|uniref:DUF6182 family protein n=1 Tax=Micromonospora sp. DT229 TaxID=3393430 RepID=UPI003CED9084
MLTKSSPLDQRVLADILTERVALLGGATVDSTPVADTRVLVLISSLSPSDVADGARRFAALLQPEEAAAWQRSWTRTHFLFGNHVNVRSGGLRLVSPGGTAAWLGPFADDHRPGISRLLKPVTGRLPELPTEVDVPGTGKPRALWINVEQLSLADYLVHLHHTIAEAVLFGRMRPDESLRLHHTTEFDVAFGSGLPAYARVLPEPSDTGRLRLHTWLSRA